MSTLVATFTLDRRLIKKEIRFYFISFIPVSPVVQYFAQVLPNLYLALSD